ncbi:MAG TPA: helix-turn-helix domain-containing protein [Candidatus Baltobacteraceae bacterium]|nr:helix-turn-helix domain-containing protein [Candidatus Baltobacteraceae bacterium]
MAPRSYQLGKRAASIEETRRRIIDAIVALHAERGVVATTALDVARRADVAVGTVLRHFPSLDAMVRACGPVVHQHLRFPTPAIFEGVAALDARLRRLCEEMFRAYERGARWIASAATDVDKVPALAESVAQLNTRRLALIDAALAPFDASDELRRLAVALTAFPVWTAMVAAGFDTPNAATTTAELLNHAHRAAASGAGKDAT